MNRHHRRPRTSARLPTLVAVGTCLWLPGCAAGNAPEFTSPQAQTLFLRTSGTWVIDEQYSEPASMALEPMRDIPVTAPGPEAEVVQDFYPIGQRMDINRSNVAGRQDPAAMRQVVLMTSLRPERLRLSLSGETFSVRYGDGDAWDVPMGGSKVSVPGQLYSTDLRVIWEESGSPTLESEVNGGGVLRDNFQVLSNERLILTRQAVFSGEVWQPTRFVYTRAR